jgi:hypothetical protein
MLFDSDDKKGVNIGATSSSAKIENEMSEEHQRRNKGTGKSTKKVPKHITVKFLGK